MLQTIRTDGSGILTLCVGDFRDKGLRRLFERLCDLLFRLLLKSVLKMIFNRLIFYLRISLEHLKEKNMIRYNEFKYLS